MLYDFDTVINRWHTDSEKYDGLKKFAPKAPDNSFLFWMPIWTLRLHQNHSRHAQAGGRRHLWLYGYL